MRYMSNSFCYILTEMNKIARACYEPLVNFLCGEFLSTKYMSDLTSRKYKDFTILHIFYLYPCVVASVAA